LKEYKEKREAQLAEQRKQEEERKAQKAEEAKEAAKRESERLAKESERIRKDAEQMIQKISSYFTDSRDGQKYRSVKIGGKTWMAQNLNYPMGQSWCYDGDNSNCGKYGRLYDWNTAKKVCPAGWHLPSDKEWAGLFVAAGGGDKALKSTVGWKNNGNGSDGYGFSALPGGNRFKSTFSDEGSTGYWWTVRKTIVPIFDDPSMMVDVGVLFFIDKNVANSVRCVQD